MVEPFWYDFNDPRIARRLTLPCLAMALFLSITDFSPAAEISENKALSAMKSLEAGLKCFKWRCVHESRMIRNGTVDEDFTPSATHDAVVNIRDGRYRVESKTNLLTVGRDGEQSFQKSGRGISFNGQFFAAWTHGEKQEFGTGEIARDASRSTLNRDVQRRPHSGLQSGIPGILHTEFESERKPRFVSQYFEEWMKAGRIRSVDEEKPGVWTIRVDAPDMKHRPMLLSFEYDVNKGGVVTGMDYFWGTESRLGPPKSKMETAFAQDSKGRYVPKEITHTDFMGPGVVAVTRFSYSEFEINPKLPVDAFDLPFPGGIRVDDFVKQQRYTTGP